MHARLSAIAAALAAAALLPGCYALRQSAGAGQTAFAAPREIDPAAIALPAGYRIEAVATGLTFPTGVAFDAQGVPHVVEAGYSYGDVFTTPRLLRIEPGTKREVARGESNGPWTGAVFKDGAFYVAEGGQREGGRILRVSADGRITPLVQNLPGMGDHHVNGPAIGPDGAVYFGVGVATNAGVVGEDNFKFGWLKRFPRFHDIPCRDIELAGHNFESANVLAPEKGKVRTGAFVPFGTQTSKGQVIAGQVPCSGAVLKVDPAGGKPELVAWGFRNPFGLAFSPSGELYVTDNGYDDRGSRPLWATPDVLWRVETGAWYGWPDYSEGRPVAHRDYQPQGKEEPKALLAREPGKPPRPAAIFAVHSSADGLDFSRSAAFGHAGQAFVAEFGDEAPSTGKTLHPVGAKVVRVDVATGHVEDFAVNKGKWSGPASRIGGGGLERPVSARFDPSGSALYIVDFGVFLEDKQGAKPQPGTGVLWKVTRQ